MLSVKILCLVSENPLFLMLNEQTTHLYLSAAPYVVGSNPNSPSNPHSAMASGGDDIGAIDTSPAQEAYVLYGAIVGGPDNKDRFYDIRSDWVETEVSVFITISTKLFLFSTSSIASIGLQRPDANDRRNACPKRYLRPLLHLPPSRRISQEQTSRHTVRCCIPLRSSKTAQGRDDRYWCHCGVGGVSNCGAWGELDLVRNQKGWEERIVVRLDHTHDFMLGHFLTCLGL
jgi:hypothetical protein